MRSSRVSNFIVNMQWNRPLWQRRTHLSQRVRTTSWTEVKTLEKWIMAKCWEVNNGQMSPISLTSYPQASVVSPLIGSRPSSEGLFFNSCLLLVPVCPILCVFCANFFDPLCKYLSNVWVAEVKDNLYTRQQNAGTRVFAYICSKLFPLY